MCTAIAYKRNDLLYGVNKAGHFGNVPYMNSTPLPAPRGMKRQRVSFVYSRNENAVYWFSDGDITRTEKHAFS